MGLPVGGHIFFHMPDPKDPTDLDKVVSRKYTPISLVNEKGKIEFVIKVYRACDEFPSGGVMSQYLE